MNKIKYLIPVIIILLISGCGEKKGEGQNKLLYWSSNNQDEIIFAKEIVDKWNRENPGTSVHFQPVPEGQSSEEVILAAVVGKTTPDIYSNMWQGDVEAYARAGVLVKLDDMPGFREFIYSRCDSAVIKEITSSDGHIYQIPWKINPIMLIENSNIIKNLGFSNPPHTYSEFFDAAGKFQKDNNNDGYVDQWFGYSEVIVTWWQRFFDFYPLYLAASGGAPLIQNNKAVFNNKAAVDVFRFLRDLYAKNYFSRERLSARQDVFLDGVIATRFTGPWEIAHAEKFKPKGFQYSFAQLPVPDYYKGKAYTYGDPKNIVIFKTCKNPELALRFLMFEMSKENDLRFLKISKQIPRRKDLTTDPEFVKFFNESPGMKPFAEQAKYVRGTDNCAVLKEAFDLISQEYEACVVYAKKTPEQAVKDAADAVDLLLKK
jgi:multiple sugar transport system substrate-binding protein